MAIPLRKMLHLISRPVLLQNAIALFIQVVLDVALLQDRRTDIIRKHYDP